jgi:uncharacterized protein
MKTSGNFFSRPVFDHATTCSFYSWGALLFLFFALMVPLALAPPAAAAAEKPQNTLVELDAEGQVEVKPDKATFNFSVVTEAPQAQEASQANAKEAEKFLDAIKKVLGPEDKVKTLNFNVNPVFRSVEKVQGKEKLRKDEIAGYRASHRFQVELRDLNKLGPVADTALKNGANEVHGPYFSHSQEEDLRNQAVVKALERARKLAEALAQAAGLKVARVTKMSTSHAVHPRFEMAKAAPMAAPGRGVDTPIEVGDITYRARLTVTYELAP